MNNQLINLKQMRNRYFSPQNSTNFIKQNVSASNKLRLVGSIAKLQINNPFSEEKQINIGRYNYNMSKQIGAGYSSKVYKAYSSKDSNQYAIKVIELKKYSSSSLKMLQSQINILLTLDHPNVIKCFDVYKTRTHCYIITEYCCNGDLLNYLTRRGKLKERVTISIMNQIIEGVKYLMRLGIIHRDLKPANILSNKQHWKIADFGFAIYSECEIKTRHNVGTPLYMPLQALLRNIYSPLSDIFSVGVIFYQLLTGITPWQSTSQKELISKMLVLPFYISEQHTITSSTKHHLQKLCSIEIQKRCSKQQFLQLKMKKTESENPQQLKRLKSSKRLERNKSKLVEQLHKSTSNITIQHNKSLKVQQPSAKKLRIQSNNNHILINQLHYCRFIYYMTKNLHCMLISTKNKNKMALILYNHLQKLIKKLSDDKENWFKLKNWDNFKQSKKYYTTHLTLKEYSTRYEKQYLNLLKQTQINSLRQISKDLNEITTSEILSMSFYRNLIINVAPIIREFNHNLTLVINKNESDLTSQNKGHIQGIKSLYKYYKLIQLSMEEFESFQIFYKKSEIKVQIDYRSAINTTIDQFLQLRQQLKLI